MVKYSKNIVVDLNQIKNVVFEPYTRENIIEIMKIKFKEIEKKTQFTITVSDRALTFAASQLDKVKKGDMRIVLEFLKNLVN